MFPAKFSEKNPRHQTIFKKTGNALSRKYKPLQWKRKKNIKKNWISWKNLMKLKKLKKLKK